MKENLIASECFYFKDIPGAEEWVELIRIADGDSADPKYSVRNGDGEQFFIRLSDPGKYDRLKNEYEHLKSVAMLGVPVPSPLGFGLCGNGRSLYLQTSWIYGRPGETVLNGLDKLLQYELGITAGLSVKLIHSRPALGRTADSWETLQRERWHRLLQAYHGCGSKIPYDHKLISLIEGSLSLMKCRPQRLLHGSFHTGNIVLSYENSLNLVDLNDWQYGDPLFDFAHVMAETCQVYRYYAVGILDCYFAFEVDELSFRLMNLYAAMELVGQIVRTVGNPAHAKAVLERAQNFIRYLQGCKQSCPTWYKNLCNTRN